MSELPDINMSVFEKEMSELFIKNGTPVPSNIFRKEDNGEYTNNTIDVMHDAWCAAIEQAAKVCKEKAQEVADLQEYKAAAAIRGCEVSIRELKDHQS